MSFDFYVENVNLLPDLVFYVVILLMAVFLRRQISHRVPLVIISAIGAITSAGIGILEKDFFSRFEISAVIKSFEAYSEYNLLVVLYVVKAIVFALLTCILLKELYGVFSKHIVIRHKDNDSYAEEHGKTLKIRIYVALALAILSAISTVYRVLALPYHDVSWIYYYSGIITSVVQISFIISICTTIMYLISEIRYSYKTFL